MVFYINDLIFKSKRLEKMKIQTILDIKTMFNPTDVI